MLSSRSIESKAASFLLLTIAFLLSSCGGQHFRVPAEGPPSNAARYVELARDKQVATLHFPAGLYSFYAMDDQGYYYRAPRSIIEHTAGISTKHNGGVYVSKRNPQKLRGYVYLPGGVTHVGDFSRVPHEFVDSPETPNTPPDVR